MMAEIRVGDRVIGVQEDAAAQIQTLGQRTPPDQKGGIAGQPPLRPRIRPITAAFPPCPPERFRAHVDAQHQLRAGTRFER